MYTKYGGKLENVERWSNRLYIFYIKIIEKITETIKIIETVAIKSK